MSCGPAAGWTLLVSCGAKAEVTLVGRSSGTVGNRVGSSTVPTGTGAPTGTAARSCSELSGPFNSAAEQPSRVPTVKILHARLRENVQKVCAATFVDDADHPPNSISVGSTTI